MERPFIKERYKLRNESVLYLENQKEKMKMRTTIKKKYFLTVTIIITIKVKPKMLRTNLLLFHLNS